MIAATKYMKYTKFGFAVLPKAFVFFCHNLCIEENDKNLLPDYTVG